MKFLRKLLKNNNKQKKAAVGRRRNAEADETSSTEGSGLGSRATTDSSTDTTTARNEASPWEAENFLTNGPPREADWWQDDDDEINTDDDYQPSVPPAPRVFVNRGLDTWNRGRAVWNSSSSTAQQSPRPRPVIPDSFRRDLVKCLSDRRQFELSQRIPLSIMIDAYQEVWKGDQ